MFVGKSKSTGLKSSGAETWPGRINIVTKQLENVIYGSDGASGRENDVKWENGLKLSV